MIELFGTKRLTAGWSLEDYSNEQKKNKLLDNSPRNAMGINNNKFISEKKNAELIKR